MLMSEGKRKKLGRLFTNINGEKVELSKLQVLDQYGAVRSIFNKNEKTKTLVASLISQDNSTEQHIDYTLQRGVVYEALLIGHGGDGGKGGNDWGLYHGGGGSGGTAGGVVMVKFKKDGPSDCVIRIACNASYQSLSAPLYFPVFESSWLYTPDNWGDILTPDGSHYMPLLNIFASGGLSGHPGDDAGAFKPNPGPGSGSIGVGGVCNNTALDDALQLTILESQIFESFASSDGGDDTGSPAGNPVQMPYTIPPYIAQAGQDAYYSTDINTLCLGNAGGGGNHKQNGGKGAPGGILLYAYI